MIAKFLVSMIRPWKTLKWLDTFHRNCADYHDGFRNKPAPPQYFSPRGASATPVLLQIGYKQIYHLPCHMLHYNHMR